MCGTMKTGAMVVVVGVDEVISRALCQSEAISYTVYFPIRSPHTFGTLHHAIFSSPFCPLNSIPLQVRYTAIVDVDQSVLGGYRAR